MPGASRARSSPRAPRAPSRRRADLPASSPPPCPGASPAGIRRRVPSRRCASTSTTSSASSSARCRRRSRRCEPGGRLVRDQLPFARGPHRQALHALGSREDPAFAGLPQVPAVRTSAPEARRARDLRRRDRGRAQPARAQCRDARCREGARMSRRWTLIALPLLWVAVLASAVAGRARAARVAHAVRPARAPLRTSATR